MAERELVLRRRHLSGSSQCFGVVPLGEAPTNTILKLRVHCFSIDPVMTVWISGAQTYYPKLDIDSVMHCFGLATVTESKSEDYQPGDLVFGNTGCSTLSYVDEKRMKSLSVIPKELIDGFSPEEFVYLMNNGLAAYGGISVMGNLTKEDTVVVSTAAGATGLLVLQILKHRGINAVGLTSSNKLQYVRDLCGKAVDYKDHKALVAALKTTKFKYYFDNVGEWLLDEIIRFIQPKGVISLCGATSNYLNYSQRTGFKNYMAVISKQLTLRGFNFAMFLPEVFEIFELFRQMKKVKALNLHIQTIPLEKFESSYRKLMRGDTIGKIIVKMDQQPSAKL